MLTSPLGLCRNLRITHAHLGAFCLLGGIFMAQKDFQSLKAEVIALTHKIPFVEMKYYGFPDNWQNLI